MTGITWIRRIALLLVASLSSSEATGASIRGRSSKTVSVIGLGSVGRAIASCLAEDDKYQVHAWSQNQTIDFDLDDSVILYKELRAAVESSSSSVVIMAVTGDANLQSANAVIQSIPESAWKEKTIVQYTSHEPTAISKQQELLNGMDANLVGGALLASPDALCSDRGISLVSVNNQPTDLQAMNQVLPILHHLGPVEVLNGHVGLASLVEIGVTESLWHHTDVRAGHRLAHLMIDCFDGTPPEFHDEYSQLVARLLPAFLTGAGSFVPTISHYKVEMHLAFAHQLGITDHDDFVSSVLNQHFNKAQRDLGISGASYFLLGEGAHHDEL